ncbi:hypothetical protein NDU88_002999 [Pleurodeles waltl]|uniref:Uncharacterized protein n=1 Tax=Pleurodeles waltl TaxID=8319 RepID=A0AAV7T587_PLEWA|nr:hypothetical protein NDU88_002999 [Pleurodeles waltl]
MRAGRASPRSGPRSDQTNRRRSIVGLGRGTPATQRKRPVKRRLRPSARPGAQMSLQEQRMNCELDNAVKVRLSETGQCVESRIPKRLKQESQHKLHWLRKVSF